MLVASLSLNVQVECLESACIQYLCNQAPNLKANRSAEPCQTWRSLGLAAICKAAAELLVQFSWGTCMLQLAEVVRLPVHELDSNKKDNLLHRAERALMQRYKSWNSWNTL